MLIIFSIFYFGQKIPNNESRYNGYDSLFNKAYMQRYFKL